MSIPSDQVCPWLPPKSVDYSRPFVCLGIYVFEIQKLGRGATFPYFLMSHFSPWPRSTDNCYEHLLISRQCHTLERGERVGACLLTEPTIQHNNKKTKNKKSNPLSTRKGHEYSHLTMFLVLQTLRREGGDVRTNWMLVEIPPWITKSESPGTGSHVSVLLRATLRS